MANNNQDDISWTAEEMIQNAGEWSLAGDVAVLNYLKQFSEKVLTETVKISNNVDNQLNTLNQVSLKLDLVKNEFHSLRNSQFIESRVYEDDETAEVIEENQNGEQNKTEKVQTEEQKQERIRNAILKGVNVMKQYYEKVEMDVSDSDENNENSFILKPKDLYAHRPLPYIVGTDEWHQKWHVGLLLTDSEEESEKEEEVYSSSDSESGLPKDRVPASETSSELSFNIPNVGVIGPAANSTFNDTVDRRSDVLHEESDSQHSYPVQAPISNKNFAEQLAEKLGGVINGENVISNVNRNPIRKPQGTNFFSDEPPPLDDDFDDTILPKSAHSGLFSGGKDLFDKEDDEDQSFWGIKNNPAGQSKSELNQPTFNPYDEESSSDEGHFDKLFKKHKQTTAKKNSYLPPSNASGLPPLIDDQPPDIITKKKENPPDKKKPVGGVSIFGENSNIFANTLPKNSLQPPKSHSDDNNKTQTKKIAISNIEASKVQKEKLIVKNVEKPKSLFDQSDSDEEIISNKKEISSKNLTNKSFLKSGLFDESDDEDFFTSAVKKVPQKIAEKTQKMNTKSDLFDSDGNEHPILFSSNDKTQKGKDSKKEENSSQLNLAKTKSNLFDSDNESKLQTREIQKDLSFSSDNVETTKSTLIKKKVSLFDSDTEDEASVPGTSKTTKINVAKRYTSIFDDEEDLFGDSDDIPAKLTKDEQSKQSLFGNSDKKKNLFDILKEDTGFNTINNMGLLGESNNFVEKSNNSKGTVSVGKTIETTCQQDSNKLLFKNETTQEGDTIDKIIKTTSVIQSDNLLFKNEPSQKVEVEQNKLEAKNKLNFKAKRKTAGLFDSSDEFSEEEGVLDFGNNQNILKQPNCPDDTIDIKNSNISPKEEGQPEVKAVINAESVGDDVESKVITDTKTDDNKISIFESLHRGEDVSYPDTSQYIVNKDENKNPNEIDVNFDIDDNDDGSVEDDIEEIKNDKNIDQMVEQTKERQFQEEESSIQRENSESQFKDDDFSDLSGPFQYPKINILESSVQEPQPPPPLIGYFDPTPPPMGDISNDESSDGFDGSSINDVDFSNEPISQQRSGMFDNEPPLLNPNESSGIVRDQNVTRVDTDDSSFYPYASSTRRFSSDIFNDQESQDNLFLTRNQENSLFAPSRTKHQSENSFSALHKIPEDERTEDSMMSKVEITPSGRISDFLSSSSVFEKTDTSVEDKSTFNTSITPKLKKTVNLFATSDEDIETDDFLFNPTKKSSVNTSSVMDISNIASKNVSDFNKTEVEGKILANVKEDNIEQKDSLDEVDKKGFSSKMLDELQNPDEKVEKSSGPTTKNLIKSLEKSLGTPQELFVKDPKLDSPPKKLKHNLNINVGALLPGAAPPPKFKSVTKSVSFEDTGIKKVGKAVSFEEKRSDEVRKRKDQENDEITTEDAGILKSVTKDRARIPVKRRPSTRKGRLESLRNSIADFRLYQESSDDQSAQDSVESNVETNVAEKEIEEKRIPNKETAEIRAKEDELQNTTIKKAPHNEGGTEDLEVDKNLFSDEPKGISLIFDKPVNTQKESKFKVLETSSKTKNKIKVDSFDDGGISDNEDLFKASLKSQPKPTEKKVSKSLFDNDDTEDLFQSAVTKNIDSKSQKSLLLFDDEENKQKTEADLFGTPSSRSEGNKTILEKPKKSLFDDSGSDEEDLFGGQKSDTTLSAKPIQRKSVKTAAVKRLENKQVTDDDPLQSLH